MNKTKMTGACRCALRIMSFMEVPLDTEKHIAHVTILKIEGGITIKGLLKTIKGVMTI